MGLGRALAAGRRGIGIKRGVVRSSSVCIGPQVILASADSSLKAGMLRTLTARIDRIVHYASGFLEGSAMRRRSDRSVARFAHD